MSEVSDEAFVTSQLSNFLNKVRSDYVTAQGAKPHLYTLLVKENPWRGGPERFYLFICLQSQLGLNQEDNCS